MRSHHDCSAAEQALAAAADIFIEQGAWVSILALAETTWVLAGPHGVHAPELAASLQLLLDHKNLTIQDSDAVEAALRLFRLKPSLGFPDCLMLELARKAGYLPLGTFDRKLSKMDGTQKL